MAIKPLAISGELCWAEREGRPQRPDTQTMRGRRSRAADARLSRYFRAQFMTLPSALWGVGAVKQNIGAEARLMSSSQQLDLFVAPDFSKEVERLVRGV